MIYGFFKLSINFFLKVGKGPTYRKTILYYPRHTPDKTIKNTNKERKKIRRIKIKIIEEKKIYIEGDIIYKTHKDIYNI